MSPDPEDYEHDCDLVPCPEEYCLESEYARQLRVYRRTGDPADAPDWSPGEDG